MLSQKFRKFTASSGNLVLAGRNAEQNEQIIGQAKPGEIVLHTKAAGSPFCNVKGDAKEISREDAKEAAIFCARYSRDWKQNKRDVKVHVFKGKDIYKEKGMKIGTFGARKFKEIIVKKEDIEGFEKAEKEANSGGK
jgi:predicted ribosome quality control (RQC) complex YloA/Tae2 family protein